MYVNINDYQEIIGYSIIGSTRGSIKLDSRLYSSVPPEFISNFKPKLYMLEGNNIVLNPNYKKEINTEDTNNVSLIQRLSELEKEIQTIKGGVLNGNN